MQRIHLASHLTTDELEACYRRAHEPTERSWWQILWLLARGQTAKAVAESTGYSRYWIGQIAKRYNTEGPAGMVNRQHTRARRTPLLLSSAQLDELRQALSGPAPAGERWTSRLVAAWMSERLGRPVAEQRGWDYLQRLGARLRQPRPRHVAASAEEQAAFKSGASAESRGGNHLSGGPGPSLGDRRTPHRAQADPQAGLDLAGAAAPRAG